MSYQCEIIEKSDQPVLSLRTRTAVQDLPEVLGRSYGALAAYLAEIGQEPSGAPFVGYYNMDMQDLDIEIGFPVPDVIKGKGELREGQLPGGKMATCLYVGPYKEIEPAYNALTEFMKQEAVIPTGVAYEFYLNDPQTTPEEELETQILFPLKE